MRLQPRYNGPPIISLDGDPAEVATPAVRQRTRMLEHVSTFSEQEWNTPSRCDGWTARDVISHLDSTNNFWLFSIASGLAGNPTEALTIFDPVATPAEMATADRDAPLDQLLERFTQSTNALVSMWTDMDADGWTALAEAPPGHLSISATTHHALWDSWIHERDVALPLGRTPAVEPDEVAASLRYAAALGPAVDLDADPSAGQTVTVGVTDPEVRFTVSVSDQVSVRTGEAPGADAQLGGDAVSALEMLSFRSPVTPDALDGVRRLGSGLAAAFGTSIDPPA